MRTICLALFCIFTFGRESYLERLIAEELYKNGDSLMEKLKIESDNLRSVSINDLIIGENEKTFCFLIPSYQRGYRWDEEQVEKLLDDLLEFYYAKDRNDATVGEFYCLQPIVVKAIDKDIVLEELGLDYPYNDKVQYIEVVDGQQRLTTVYIFLKYLSVRDPSFFDIEYERDAKNGFTRKKFLVTISSVQSSEKSIVIPQNADEYYFNEAFNNVKKWFKTKKDKLKNTNLENNIETVLKEKTKVIWYELPKDSMIDCYSVFRNINNGKIPLTDAELVKAMLLNSKYFSPNSSDKEANDKIIRQEQERYARLWDEIQKALNDETLWAFITGNHDFGVHTRIDFLFKIAVMQKQPDYSQYGTLKLFSFYESKLAELSIDEKRKYIASVFEDIRKIYRTIQDWSENYKIYNFIGYMMTYKETGRTEAEKSMNRLKLIVDLLNRYEGETRTNFAENLIVLIKKDFDRYELDTVNYEENPKEVEKLLMLFNIVELNNIREKFAFLIGKSGWSVEHIKAQHSQIVKPSDRIDYLKKENTRIEKSAELEIYDSRKQKLIEIKTKISKLIISAAIADDEFTRLAEEIDKEVDGFEEDDMHRLGNLALLGKDNNASFNNSPFYEKRKIMLIWLNDNSKNIPYSTIRVFLKNYSRQEFTLDFTKWSKADFNSYFAKQTDFLKTFIREVL